MEGPKQKKNKNKRASWARTVKEWKGPFKSEERLGTRAREKVQAKKRSKEQNAMLIETHGEKRHRIQIEAIRFYIEINLFAAVSVRM